jgi:hypothetical protein
MADTENRGFLLMEDFAKALRLIGQYQAQPGRTLDHDLALLRTWTILAVALGTKTLIWYYSGSFAQV